MKEGFINLLFFLRFNRTCLKPQKQLRSSFIRNSLKSFVVASLIKKFQVCAVSALALKQRNIWLQRRKMEKLLQDNEHIVGFFSCIIAMVENKKAKEWKRRNNSESSGEDVEECSSNNCGISFWTVFYWSEYGISSFAEHISR